MRALILSCNTGEGHNAAGRAVLEKMQALAIPCEMKDTLSFAGPTVSDTVSKTYIGVTTKAPAVFGALYGAGSLISSSKHHSPVYYANRVYRRRLRDYIEENGFDTVIMPHLFPAQTITAMKAEGPVSFRSVAIATDYTCIPFWEETDMDDFIVPHESLVDEFVKKGVRRECIRPLGIPVREDFYHKQPKAKARKQLGLDERTPTVLMMSGSMGFGHMEALVRKLLKAYSGSVQIVLLTGTNQKLKHRLNSLFGKFPKVHIVDFTLRVSLYMDACDVLFTKPGGLTSTEAAVKQIPFIHTRPIPGCETKNARFFAQRQMSVSCRDLKEQMQTVDRLLRYPAYGEGMCEAQRLHMPPNAGNSLIALLESEA